MAVRPKVLSIVLAGGEGKRLLPLTADRAKPAVPFGGTYRLIDFVLSNLVNGGEPKNPALAPHKKHPPGKHPPPPRRVSPTPREHATPLPAPPPPRARRCSP